MKLSINFGAMVPRISEQLEQHGITAKTGDTVKWQRDAEAITRLAVRGLLTDAAAQSARKKLLRDIVSRLKGSP